MNERTVISERGRNENETAFKKVSASQTLLKKTWTPCQCHALKKQTLFAKTQSASETLEAK